MKASEWCSPTCVLACEQQKHHNNTTEEEKKSSTDMAPPTFRDVVTKPNGALTFILANVDISVANALRRALIAWVPTVAIERVRVLKNTSDVEDETIVHALGLVPLSSARAMEEESMVPLPFPGDCSVCTGGEEGCEVCGVKLTLHAIGPKDVTSDDIVSEDPETVPSVQSKISKTPINLFRLKEGEEVHIEATAQKGRGAVHAKWSPVCPAVFVPERDEGEMAQGAAEENSHSTQTFRFTIETTGALTPEQTVASALRELELATQKLQTCC
jgi:DNA-directed RNA polymerase alpha subunit